MHFFCAHDLIYMLDSSRLVLENRPLTRPLSGASRCCERSPATISPETSGAIPGAIVASLASA